MSPASNITLALLFAAILLAAGGALTSADENTEQPETVTTTLHPGDNFIGWVAEPKPVAELFAEFPRIELIYTWDPAGQQYRYAHPDVEPGSGTLDMLTSETPVTIRIGDESTSAQELFDAEPRIRFIYRWDAIENRWQAASPAFSIRMRTLHTLPAGSTVLIRVDGQMAPQDLLEALPQIDLIFREDEAEERRHYALRGLAPAVSGLNTLKPGMGLVVRVGGEESVEWVRPRRPAQGTVRLERGLNLVAWMGRDGARLDRVVQGIGRQLEKAGTWTTERESLDLLSVAEIMELDELPSVGFGDALWVQVARNQNWLQPTGVMPEIVLTGSPTRQLKAKVIADVQAVIDFYWEQYGLEADFSRFKIYFPTSAAALVNALETHSLRQDWPGGLTPGFLDSYEQAWPTRGGAAYRGDARLDSHFWVRQEYWRSSPSTRGGISFARSVTAHEYMHMLQFQLSGTDSQVLGDYIDKEWPPSWLVEGLAELAENVQISATGGLSWERLQSDARSAARGEPSLRRAERSTHLSPYGVGRAAAHELIDDSNDDSLLEFFRELASESIGPRGKWQSNATWREAFLRSFGVTSDAFYQQFETSRGSTVGAGTVVAGHDHPPPYLSGKVSADERLELQGSRVKILVEWASDDGATHSSYDWVDVGHRFDFPVEANQSYILAVEFGTPPCVAYYARPAAVQDPKGAQILNMKRSTIRGLDLRLSPTTCAEQIQGSLLTDAGEPLPGIALSFVGPETISQSEVRPGAYRVDWAFTDSNGNFRHFLAEDSRGEMRVYLTDTCTVRVPIGDSASASKPAVGSRTVQSFAAESSIQTLDGGSTLGVTVVVRDDACAFRISGRLLNAQGIAIGDALIYAEDDTRRAYGGIAADGTFSITVPSQGLYRLRLIVDDCSVYWRRGAVPGSHEQATQIQVSDPDASDILFHLTEGTCNTKVSGRLLNAEGSGVAGVSIWVQSGDGSASGRTDSDGLFAITVPSAGSYRVSASLEGCRVYYRTGDSTGSYQDATSIAVSDVDVGGIVIRMTEGMCERRISGRLLNANGTPASGYWVSANGAAGSGRGQSAKDGSFALLVSGPGEYWLQAHAGGCWIYHGNEGPTRDRSKVGHVDVSSADVTGIEFRLPEDPAAFCG